MKTTHIIPALLLTLTGCATLPPPAPAVPAPAHLAAAQAELRQSMRYEYMAEYWSGQDVWTGGCPAVGDCEDAALCLIEKLRQKGHNPKLYNLKWNSWRTPWSHMMVRDGEWFADYNEATTTPELRRSVTHECEQITTAAGEPSWSTNGAWVCKPVDGKSGFIPKAVK